MPIDLIREKQVNSETDSFSVNIKPLKIEGAPKRQLDALANHALGENRGELAFKSVHPYLIGLNGDNPENVEKLSVAAIDFLAKNFPVNIPSLSFTLIRHETMARVGIQNAPNFAIMAVQDFSTIIPAINTVKEPFYGTFNQFLETLK
ncbi:MAG: hypothetical protein WAV41_06035 [Microgenomates group bacterium]